jgi:hypothetical protein
MLTFLVLYAVEGMRNDDDRWAIDLALLGHKCIAGCVINKHDTKLVFYCRPRTRFEVVRHFVTRLLKELPHLQVTEIRCDLETQKETQFCF